MYFVRGVETCGSVTGLLHDFVPPFDADLIIQRMQASRRWPRPNYISYQNLLALRELHRRGKEYVMLSQAMEAPTPDENEICRLVSSAVARDPQASLELLSLVCLSPAAIKEKWNKHKNEAAELGTEMHLQFERFLNRCPVVWHNKEMHLFVSFLSSLRDLQPFRTEWMVYGDAELLALFEFRFHNG